VCAYLLYIYIYIYIHDEIVRRHGTRRSRDQTAGRLCSIEIDGWRIGKMPFSIRISRHDGHGGFRRQFGRALRYLPCRVTEFSGKHRRVDRNPPDTRGGNVVRATSSASENKTLQFTDRRDHRGCSRRNTFDVFSRRFARKSGAPETNKQVGFTALGTNVTNSDSCRTRFIQRSHRSRSRHVNDVQSR